jgi:hypothetical protein
MPDYLGLIQSALQQAFIENGHLAIEIDLLPFSIPEAYLFAPKSRLIDTWSPGIEKIIMPAVTTVRGKIKIWFKVNPDCMSDNLSTYRSLRNLIQIPPDGFKCDMRLHAPSNWAHTLSNHIPLAFVICDVVRLLDLPPPVFILPQNIPQHCCDAFSFFNFQIIKSKGLFVAPHLSFKCEPWIAIRNIRHLVAAHHAPSFFSLSPHLELPAKIYLSRKDTRKIINETELFAFLDQHGFTRIFPEDLSVRDQLSMFRYADQIVAIHGAGMAPILWGDAARSLKIIELFPPSYMTNVWRVIAEQKNWPWVGVRGKLWPAICKHIYANTRPRKYSQKNFEVCMDSFASAFDSLELSQACAC